MLEKFCGNWKGEETIAPSRWGEGGPATASVAAKLALGGKLLTMDYRAERAGQPWLQAHAVITAGQSDAPFALYWFDSLGFVPQAPAPGQWDGETLTFIRGSPRGQARHSYRFLDEDNYQLVLESSQDGGASWAPVMRGQYRRV